MAKTTKAPDPRGFTLTEADTLKFQRRYMAGLVLVITATFILSFTALAWLGLAMGLPYGVHFIVPLFADGGQLIAAAAITTRKTEGRHAIPEWTGLCITLGLSVIANVYHSVELGDPNLVMWVKVAFATAIPVCVALYIHIYERSISTKLRDNILAKDPDHVRFDLAHLDDDNAPQHAPAARPAPQPARVSAPPTPRVTLEEVMGRPLTTAPPVPTTGAQQDAQDAPLARPRTRSANVEARERVEAMVDELLSREDDPAAAVPLNAAAIRTDAAADGVHAATVRQWVRDAESAWLAKHADAATPEVPLPQPRAIHQSA